MKRNVQWNQFAQEIYVEPEKYLGWIPTLTPYILTIMSLKHSNRGLLSDATVQQTTFIEQPLKETHDETISEKNNPCDQTTSDQTISDQIITDRL